MKDNKLNQNNQENQEQNINNLPKIIGKTVSTIFGGAAGLLASAAINIGILAFGTAIAGPAIAISLVLTVGAYASIKTINASIKATDSVITPFIVNRANSVHAKASLGADRMMQEAQKERALSKQEEVAQQAFVENVHGKPQRVSEVKDNQQKAENVEKPPVKDNKLPSNNSSDEVAVKTSGNQTNLDKKPNKKKEIISETKTKDGFSSKVGKKVKPKKQGQNNKPKPLVRGKG